MHTILSLLMKTTWPPLVGHTGPSRTREAATFERFTPPTGCRPKSSLGSRHNSRWNTWLIGPRPTEIWLKGTCWKRKKPKTTTTKITYEGMWELWNAPWTWLPCVWENMFHMWKKEYHFTHKCRASSRGTRNRVLTIHETADPEQESYCIGSFCFIFFIFHCD